jgi:hypothetical protein
MKRMLLATMVAMAMVAILVPTIASATVTSHSIAANGTLFSGGLFLQVGVNVNCTAGEVVIVRATATQNDAFGEAIGGLFCTGSSQSVPATMRTFGGAFETGTATLCVVVATIDRNGLRITDTEQSCANITLAT